MSTTYTTKLEQLQVFVQNLDMGALFITIVMSTG